jgi:hypothetical protein
MSDAKLDTAEGIRAFADWQLKQAGDALAEYGRLKSQVAFVIATRQPDGTPYPVATSVPIFGRPNSDAEADVFTQAIELKAAELRAIGVLVLGEAWGAIANPTTAQRAGLRAATHPDRFEVMTLSVEHLALPHSEVRYRVIHREGGAKPRLLPDVMVVAGDTAGRYARLFDKTAFS